MKVSLLYILVKLSGLQRIQLITCQMKGLDFGLKGIASSRELHSDINNFHVYIPEWSLRVLATFLDVGVYWLCMN